MDSKPDKQAARATSLTDQAINSLLWMVSSTGIRTVLNLVTFAVLARLILPNEFGLLSASMVFTSLFTIVTEHGIGPTLIQLPELDTTHVRVSFTFCVLSGFVLWVLLWLIAPYLAELMRMPMLAQVIRLLAVIIPIQSTGIVAKSLMARAMQFRLIANLQVAAYFFGFTIVGVILAVLDYGVWALVGATITQTLILMLAFLYLSPHNKRPLLEPAVLGRLFRVSGGFSIIKMGSQVALQGDYFVIGRWLGEAALGLYTKAYQLMTMPALLFGEALFEVSFASMSRVQKERSRLTNGFRRGLSITNLLVTPLGVFVILLAPELVLLILGSTWEQAILPLQLLTIGMVFRTGYKLSDSLARAKGIVYTQAKRQWAYALLVIVGAWIGQHWGIIGVCIGIVVSLFIYYLIMSHLTMSIIDLSWRDLFRLHVRGILLGLLVGLICFPITTWLRYTGASNIVTLLSTLMLLVAILGSVVLWQPQFLLGKDGIWLLRTVMGKLPCRMRKDWLIDIYIERLSVKNNTCLEQSLDTLGKDEQ